MIYRVNGMILSSVRNVFCGPANDVVVCRDIASALTVYYFLVVIKDRECAKRMLETMEFSEKRSEQDERPYLRCFSEGEYLCYLFEYRPERRLFAFAEGQTVSVNARETVCVNMVMECLSTLLPYPLLYLALEQGQVHIQKDNQIYFTPCLDLSELDPGVTEGMCATSCVRIILQILRGNSRKKIKSLTLLEKKERKSAYRSLPEIYRDIRATALPEHKTTLKQRLRHWWSSYKDVLFRILVGLSLTVAVFALIVLVSQLLFGDVPLFRLFYRSFDVIGTETLRTRS